MNNKNLYFILLVINVILLLVVVFTDYKITGSVIGIIILILSYFYGLKLERDLSRVRKINIGRSIIEFSGIEAIFFGLFGLYQMMKSVEQTNIIWIYYLLFNLFILSQAYIRIRKKQVHKS